MGKKRGFHGAVQHPNFYEKKQTSQKLVWVPKIASWEKEFCYKVGLFTWENFLECKKQTRSFSHNKILEWDDSAAEEAFHRSKNRFLAMITNPAHACEDDDSSPDLYIDEINWDDEDEGEDKPGLEQPLILKSDRYENIKPTGWEWDCKVEEFSPGKILTGQIIGY
ncbi:hypothetical protein C2S51_003287 [Perilla frutescens var. frutescens]|nr:hypothetical protein C2S51_003287 [Perilla frutescens var. frutescens]